MQYTCYIVYCRYIFCHLNCCNLKLIHVNIFFIKYNKILILQIFVLMKKGVFHSIEIRVLEHLIHVICYLKVEKQLEVGH